MGFDPVLQANTKPPNFKASGARHARGAVPDPGGTAGTTRFLREDATWQVPPGGGGGGGTVTSVGLATDGPFTVSGSPVTTSGTLTFNRNVQSANAVWAGPQSGGAQVPTFRPLVAADIPALPYVTSVGLALPTQFTSGSPVTTSGTLTAAWNTQAANTVLAGPASGAAAAPTFRALVAADIPALPSVTSISAGAGITCTPNPITATGTVAVATQKLLNTVFFTDVAAGTVVTGDLLAGQSGSWARLAGDASNARKFLRTQATGGVANAPAWDTVLASDVGSGAALTVVSDPNVTLALGGTPASALLAAASVTAGWAGQLAIGRGGTGQATAGAAFDALAPTTTLGDLSYYGSGSPANVRLAGTTSATKQFLTQTGTGAVSAAPAWGPITASDLPGSFSGFANPTATIGLVAVNGAATTALRSDAAPPLSQAIAPTWTGQHVFQRHSAFGNAASVDPSDSAVQWIQDNLTQTTKRSVGVSCTPTWDPSGAITATKDYLVGHDTFPIFAPSVSPGNTLSGIIGYSSTLGTVANPVAPAITAAVHFNANAPQFSFSTTGTYTAGLSVQNQWSTGFPSSYGVLINNQTGGFGQSAWAIKTGTGLVEFGDVVQGDSIISAATGYQIARAAAAVGHYLRGNGTNYVDSPLQSADVSPLAIAGDVIGTIGATSVQAFRHALLLGA